ncbi:MAG: exopolysaccharide biosynthesis protein [Acidipila sp.]|nr:exopolysaccharide biosynthesis protein [Acidipila sp.]
MVDIHCHLLPGLDDGPETMDQSVLMAEAAIADGITCIVATPHANDQHVFDPERIGRFREELQQAVGARLQIYTGCDFHMSYENLEAVRKDPSRYTLNQKNYLLVEFANFSLPPFLDGALHELQLQGLRVIITHPERNPLVRSRPERLHGWVTRGCYVQVTALSLSGRFGAEAQRAAEEFLDWNWIHFIASDAHGLHGRPPRLSEAFALVSRRAGPEVAQGLFHDNPLAACLGQPLPFVPEAALPGSPAAGRRKRFRFF